MAGNKEVAINPSCEGDARRPAGLPVVNLPHTDEALRKEDRLSRCVIVEVIRGSPSPQEILYELCLRWPESSSFRWTLLKRDSHTFCVDCGDDGQLNSVLRAGRIFAESFTFYLTKWSLSLGEWSPQRMDQYWVRLYNLPYLCWNIGSIQALMVGFSQVVGVDSDTKFGTTADYARVRVRTNQIKLFSETIIATYQDRWYLVRLQIEKKVTLYSTTATGESKQKVIYVGGEDDDDPGAVIEMMKADPTIVVKVRDELPTEKRSFLVDPSYVHNRGGRNSGNA